MQGQKNVHQVTSLVTHLSASQLTNSNWLQVKVLSGAGAVTNPSRFKNEALSGPVITNREITWKLTLGPEAHLGDVALKKKTKQTKKQNRTHNPKTTNKEKTHTWKKRSAGVKIPREVNTKRTISPSLFKERIHIYPADLLQIMKFYSCCISCIFTYYTETTTALQQTRTCKQH